MKIKKSDVIAFFKKKWVIRTIAGLIAVVVLLVFFSSTIINWSLAKVKAYRPTSGSISASIVASGEIIAEMQDRMYADGVRRVESINVQQGDTITIGQSIAMIEPVVVEDNLDYQAASEELATLITAQRQKEIEAGKSANRREYASLEQAIQNAQDDLTEARKQVTEANKKSSLQSEVNRLQSSVSTYTGQVDSLSAEVQAYGDTLNTAISNLSEKQALFSEAEQDYLQKKQIYDEKKAANEAAGIPANSTVDGPSEDALWVIMEDARLYMETFRGPRDAAQKSVDDIRGQISAKSSELQAASTRKATAEQSLSTAQSRLNSVPDLDVAQKAQRTAQEALDTAQKRLVDQRGDDTIQVQLDAIKDEEERIKMEKAQNKVNKLRDSLERTEILSTIEGVVASVEMQEGAETVDGDIILVVDLQQEGYKTEISFKTEEAELFEVGMAANSDYNVEQAVISSIRIDPSDPVKRRLVVFSLVLSNWGYNIQGGQVTLSLLNQSKSFDCILPKGAIVQDAAGQFVYVVNSRSTIFGERNVVEKIKVEIIGVSANGEQVAIDPTALNELPVILSSTKPIEAGNLVRIMPE